MELQSLSIKVKRSENLPVLPQVVSEVLRLADDPDCSPNRVEKIIERDPAIAAKILKVANSPYYGQSRVPTISRAISVLGINLMRSLVVGIAYQQVIGARETAKGFSKMEFWRHSVATATAARILGKLRMPAKAEELFCAAMMHDIGYLVLDRFEPKEFERAIAFAMDSHVPLFEAENQIMGLDHAQVGGLLADEWSLSPMMKHGILYHHCPIMDGEYYETTCFLAAANSLAHQCGFHGSGPAVEYDIDEDVAEAVGLPIEQFGAIRDVIVAEVARTQEAFHIK